MFTIITQIIGVVVFVAGTTVFGLRIREQSDRLTAKRTLRVNRFLCWSCLVLPALVGVAYPGATQYDILLGLSPLPFRPLLVLVGGALLLTGLYLLLVAHRRQADRGRPAAFTALRKMPREGPYRRVRNPISLGYYLGYLGIGLLANSTAITLGGLLVIIPSHLFNLLFFREHTRETLYGSAYAAYRRRVPFLIPRFWELKNSVRD